MLGSSRQAKLLRLLGQLVPRSAWCSHSLGVSHSAFWRLVELVDLRVVEVSLVVDCQVVQFYHIFAWILVEIDLPIRNLSSYVYLVLSLKARELYLHATVFLASWVFRIVWIFRLLDNLTLQRG